jgi:2-oxoglutarate ferredoxin oxidoreductase subunit alpha
LTIRAFNLSEMFRTPVILLLDEIIGHTNEKIEVPSRVRVVERGPHDPRSGPYLPYAPSENDVPPMVSFGQGHRFHVTGLVHDETGFPTNDRACIDALIRRLDRKIGRHADVIVEVDRRDAEGAEVAVVAYGSTARSAGRAVHLAEEIGLPVHLLAPLTLWPFPTASVRELGDAVTDIIVPELNLGQFAHEVEWAVAGRARVHSVTRVDGEPIHPREILTRLREVTSR